MSEYSHTEIAALYEKWTKQERERIIKLIEAEIETNSQKGLAYSVKYLSDLIALIKGESK